MYHCIICSYPMMGKAVAWVDLRYPVCCKKCLEEWEDLTYKEMLHYLECERFLHSEAMGC